MNIHEENVRIMLRAIQESHDYDGIIMCVIYMTENATICLGNGRMSTDTMTKTLRNTADNMEITDKTDSSDKSELN